MKTELIKTETLKEFKPFTIQITCETIEDARLMFHIANSDNLKGTFIEREAYNFEDLECSKEFTRNIGDSLWERIESEIISQGYEL